MDEGFERQATILHHTDSYHEQWRLRVRTKPQFKRLNVAILCLFTSMLALSGVNSFAAGVGYPAPDFELWGSDGQMHRLADYHGHHVVLSFFPRAFVGR